MKRLRFLSIIALLLALTMLLCGCSMGVSVEELFTLPQLPEEYAGLSLALEELLESGYEYVTPESGENIEPIQMVDLDGDGEKSAVVFLRRSGDENPLKIFVLDPDGDSYQRVCTIESRGAGVDCVLYRDMTGDGGVNAVDALGVLQYAVGKLHPANRQLAACDVNGDGAINAKDALLILQYAVGKIDSFPAQTVTSTDA